MNLIRFYTTSFLLLWSALTFSQNIDYQWVNQTGETQWDRGMSICVDANGDVIEMGNFRGTVDMDPGPSTMLVTSVAFSDTYVKKLDPNGNLIWAKTFGGNRDDVGYIVYTDAGNNIYIVGNYSGTADFDPGAGTVMSTSYGTPPATDVFILKLTTDGDYIWSKQFGGNFYDRAFAMSSDDANNIYIGGYFEDSVDFDPGPGDASYISNGLTDTYIMKMDSLGNFIWAKAIGGIDDESIISLDIDANNDILICGGFGEVVDFDPGPLSDTRASNGEGDIFLVKLDSAGSYIWANTYGSTGKDLARCVEVDASNDIYITGYFENTIDFDPTTGTDVHTSNGKSDGFLQKFTSAGSSVWSRTFGGDSLDISRYLSLDPFGNIFIVGYFSDTTNLDPGPSVNQFISAGLADIFVSRFDTDGNYYWSEATGDTISQYCTWVDTDGNGNLYISGEMYGSADFDLSAGVATITSLGNEDAFIASYSYCIPSTSTISPTACQEYTSPSGNYVWTTSGTYIDTLYSMNQCGEDSILYINLTVNTVDIGVTQTDQLTLNADQNGANYQWIDCGSGPLIGETSQSFIASQNGDYAVIIDLAGCSDTSACMTINSVGIKEVASVSGLNCYPNPSSGKVHVDFGSATYGTLVLSDVSGRAIRKISLQGDSMITLELGNESGCYFISLETGDGVITTRVVRN